MFYNADDDKLNLSGFYRGFPAFLICSGPSFAEINRFQLARPGVLTMAVNNAPRTFRPNLWVMGDDVGNFIKSIWFDPKIVKFAPRPKRGHKVFDNEKWEHSEVHVRDCPGMVYFDRMEPAKHMPIEQVLKAPEIYWGNFAHLCVCGFRRPDPKEGGKKVKICPKCNGRHFGCRNVMFLALRILYELGVRTVFLLGVDFTMTKDHTYHFPQGRASGAVKNNNSYYEELNYRFDLMRPHFEAAKFQVFNCTRPSGLKSFDHKPFEEAVEFATKALPPPEVDYWMQWRCDEPTMGLYERKAEEKARKKAAEAAKQAKLNTMTLAELVARRTA